MSAQEQDGCLEAVVFLVVHWIFSAAWGLFAWWFMSKVGAPHWACWAIAFVSFDAQSNAGGILRRIRKLPGGAR